LPFALIYVLDPERRSASLAGISRLSRGNKAAPETVALDSPCLWPLEEVSHTRRACLVSDLTAVSDELPSGRDHYSPTQAVVLPIALPGETGNAGILVVGLNPLRPFEGNYQRFLDRVAGGISTAIANARAYEAERAEPVTGARDELSVP
jgi:GAF domain-containing protein